ncbi:MAG: hypothetical protein Q7U64_13255 [Desulfocapsaceae bacterium]|nr:hypothetical protein [Desulfocapsaceae bacterium]
MELNALQVYEILKGRGVEFLHHANSVQTTCSFLRSGRLMSRGSIISSGLGQTPQYSDEIDKKYGIWFDVFTDTVDIHHRASRRNIYGPVLLKIKLEILQVPYMPPLWISKKNPTKWVDGEPLANRWCSSIEELKNQFIKGEFDQMIVFRHIGGSLPIKEYVSDIILDEPNQEYYGLKFYDLAAGALFSSAGGSGMQITIHKRVCNYGCKCQIEYSSNPEAVIKYYFPYT